MVWSSSHGAAVPVFTLLRLTGQKLTNRNRNLNPVKGYHLASQTISRPISSYRWLKFKVEKTINLSMSDFTVKHKFQLRMIIIPFHIRNVLSSPTETKLPPSSGRAAILMKEDRKHVKYNHVKIGKGFIRASEANMATAHHSLYACSVMWVQRTFWQWSTSRGEKPHSSPELALSAPRQNFPQTQSSEHELITVSVARST